MEHVRAQTGCGGHPHEEATWSGVSEPHRNGGTQAEQQPVWESELPQGKEDKPDWNVVKIKWVTCKVGAQISTFPALAINVHEGPGTVPNAQQMAAII